MSLYRMGIDVGGTFTDVIGIDDANGTITVRKTPTTPEDFSRGAVEGVRKLFAAVGDREALLVHGTTVGTNALLERKGVRTGLLTTRGFRDVLEIGRVQRPAEGLYDFNVDNPEPLVPRYLRLEVAERTGSKGEVVSPLDEGSVRTACATLRGEKVESVAVSLLFSFLNPAHERRVREIAQEELPGVGLSLSSEICPEFREYERTSTVVLSAYLQPIVEDYVAKLVARLRAEHPRVRLRLIQANGGVMRPEAVRGRAVNLINSGPAGGVTAASFLGRAMNEPDLISVDMGGTSFDVGMVTRAETHMTTESKFDGFPIKVPMSDVNVIGAGGGSIAWLDSGGALNVGPQSAAARPGAACYGFGGTRPTVTDANLVLGRISPDYFLGGEIPLYRERAEEAIRKDIAEPLRLSLEEAAHGIIRVVNANMIKAIAIKSIQRGYDLREFALLAFGGAGPLHAVGLADELGMKHAIIPPYPGAFSAFGLLVADARHDFVRTVMWEEGRLEAASLTSLFRELESAGLAELEKDGVPPRDREFRWSADLRFEGQSYELNVPVTRKIDVRKLLADFTAMHERIYSFQAVDEKSVLVNVRVTAFGRSPRMKLPRIATGNAKAALKSVRPVYFDKGFVKTKIYERRLLKAGSVVEGPAVVEEEISCTVVPPGRSLAVHPLGALIVR